MKAYFVSVWDEGKEIVTNCEVDLKTKAIYDIELADAVDVENLEFLEREFVRLPDGTELEVDCDPIDNVYYLK